MTRVQRRRHLVIWAVLAPLLLAVLLVAVRMNPARGQITPGDEGVARRTPDAGETP